MNMLRQERKKYHNRAKQENMKICDDLENVKKDAEINSADITKVHLKFP